MSQESEKNSNVSIFVLVKYPHMKTILNWKKGPFSTTYQIFSGEEPFGQLKDHAFKQTAHGVIRNRQYRFKTTGLFKQETRIIDRDTGQEIGTISYNSMMSKATIRFTDRTIYWKYDNGWQTKWSLFDDNGIRIKFAGGFSKGTIEYQDPDDLLVLTGLFVTNYYRQIGIAVFVAIFIPVWITAIN